MKYYAQSYFRDTPFSPLCPIIPRTADLIKTTIVEIKRHAEELKSIARNMHENFRG